MTGPENGLVNKGAIMHRASVSKPELAWSEVEVVADERREGQQNSRDGHVACDAANPDAHDEEHEEEVK